MCTPVCKTDPLQDNNTNVISVYIELTTGYWLQLFRPSQISWQYIIERIYSFIKKYISVKKLRGIQILLPWHVMLFPNAICAYPFLQRSIKTYINISVAYIDQQRSLLFQNDLVRMWKKKRTAQQVREPSKVFQLKCVLKLVRMGVIL